MGTCQPPIQNFGAPNGLFCVGHWQCYPDCNDWYWMGQRRTVNGGWVGNPFSGYTLVLKPTAPCGFPGGGQSAPPPPPQTPPAPPPPASGQPVETTQPKPPHDTAPPSEHDQCGSGASMAPTLEMERDFGFNSDEQAGWPGVGKFVGVNKYASLQTVQGETIQKQTRPTVSVPAYIEKDADGNIRVLHPATGPGEIWLAPPEIEDYHLAGEHASHTGKLAGVALPKTISRVGLNIASFKRANSSHGDDVDGYLGWGVYHPAGAYVADGWVAKLTGSIGARHLEFFSTDVEGALDSGAGGQTFKVNGTTLAGTGATVVTAASAFAGANRVLVADGADRSADDSDFTMTQDGSNVLRTANAADISFDSRNLKDIGTLASGAHTMAEQAAPSTPAAGHVVIYPKSDGLMYSKDDAGVETALGGGSGSSVRTVSAQFGGPGGSISASDTVWVRVPYTGTITKVSLLADATGSIVIDVWKDTYANYPPTVADTIAAAAKPTLSSVNKSEDATLTGWTTAVTAGDVLKFNVDSVSGLTQVSLLLEITV